MGDKHRWISLDGDMANPASWDTGEPPATAATGVLTLTGNPLNNETVTLDVKTYTFQTVLTDVDGNVLIGADPEESLDNLVAAITLGVGAGTKYAASTTLHPTVTASDGTGWTMDVTAKKTGTDGNSIATTETIISGSFGAATLEGATMWDSDDEIVVPFTTTVGMITNVDWWTNTSPVLRVERMNVDGPLTPFNKPLGSVANPLRFELKRLNYLGTGTIILDNKITGVGTANSPLYFVNSHSEVECASFNGNIGALWVYSGITVVESGATFVSSDAGMIVATLGPSAQIDLEGLDENGPMMMLGFAGIINSARMESTLTVDFWVAAPSCVITITGKILASTLIVNLGGKIKYAPENDPGLFGPYVEMLGGVTEFGETAFDLSTVTPVIGPFATVIEGSMKPLAIGKVDLREDFPL